MVMAAEKFSHVSGCAISKPNKKAYEVINQHDQAFVDRVAVANDLRCLAAETSSLDELRDRLRDYAHSLDDGAGVA